MPDIINYFNARIEKLEREMKKRDDLTEQIIRKTDEDIAFRRNLNDLLYNLDDDNVPFLNTLLRYQDEYAQALADITVTVNSQGASITELLQFKQVIEATDFLSISEVEALIYAEVNESGGIINNYLAGNFYTKTVVDGMLITTASTVTSQILQEVGPDLAAIRLLVTNGQVNAGIIVQAINNDSSVIIAANRISLAGKNINLTGDNITISSNNFNVDRYGNLTANNGTFTGVVNATGGNISGRLTMGGDNNFYISGNDLYRIYINGTQGSFSVDRYGNMVAFNGMFTGVTVFSGTADFNIALANNFTVKNAHGGSPVDIGTLWQTTNNNLELKSNTGLNINAVDLINIYSAQQIEIASPYIFITATTRFYIYGDIQFGGSGQTINFNGANIIY